MLDALLQWRVCNVVVPRCRLTARTSLTYTIGLGQRNHTQCPMSYTGAMSISAISPKARRNDGCT